MTNDNERPTDVVKVDGGLKESLVWVLEELNDGIITITDLTEALLSESDRLELYINEIAGEEVRVANTLLNLLSTEIGKLNKEVEEAAWAFSSAVAESGRDPRLNEHRPLKYIEWTSKV
jgi:hypothetical protein